MFFDNSLIMKEIYVDYARYNVWANQRMAELFSDLTEAEAEQHFESSFPSVRKTILHIWDAEVIWLKRLRGEKIEDFPSRNFSGDFKEVLAGWLANSKDFLHFVEGLSEAELEAEHSFQTISGGANSHRASEMIHHCMNHSTYHRGQLTTFARQLGRRKIPSTDMIFYQREKQGA
jgi:uncharacterized damage-inducible protein DinB